MPQIFHRKCRTRKHMTPSQIETAIIAMLTQPFIFSTQTIWQLPYNQLRHQPSPRRLDLESADFPASRQGCDNRCCGNDPARLPCRQALRIMAEALRISRVRQVVYSSIKAFKGVRSHSHLQLLVRAPEQETLRFLLPPLRIQKAACSRHAICGHSRPA